MVFPSISKNNFVSPNCLKTNKTGTSQAASNISGSKVPNDSLSLSNAAKSASTAESSLNGFLTKVENGTVTDDDLKKMQSLLKTAPPDFPSGIADRVGFKGTDSDLKSFLSKVGNGTITDDDLKKMQTQLPINNQPVMSNMDDCDEISNSTPIISIS